MAGDSRTEAPTPRRREQARRKGQVARSREISSVAILLAGLVVLSHQASDLLARHRAVASEAFLQVAMRDERPEAVLALAGSLVSAGAMTIAPLVVAVTVVGVAVDLAQVGPMLSLEPIKPDVGRINPINGLNRLWSARSLVELAKSIVKLGVTTFVAYQVIKERYPELAGLQVASAEGALGTVGSLMMEIGVKCGLALVVMAAADYGYQRHAHETSLKMSRHDIKEEARQAEGDPHLKARLRQMAKQMASRRMMQSVPRADVVITNPVHVAVALEYKPGRMKAPVVTAKGQLRLAEKIKQIAREHGVPVVENPPLARALYQSVEIGVAIPPALYQAVAEVLAFIYRLRNARAASV